MSGGILFYNGSYISAFARKQTIVALSTAEAEYIALSEMAKLFQWKRFFGFGNQRNFSEGYCSLQ